MRPEIPSRAADAVIARLADRQRGVVARWQLLRLGVGEGAIKARIRSGRLRPVHRGVYLVGHRVPVPAAREMAAVLACGPGAVVSHRSAAAIHRLLPYPANADVWVTVTNRHNRHRPGIRVHRSERLEARDVRRLDGLPVTSPARALLDLALVVDDEQLEQAVAEAHVRGLAKEADLREQLRIARGRRGAGRLRALLDRAADPALTQSKAERLLWRLIRSAGLPNPDPQAQIGPYRVDFLWPDAKVIAEVDGFAYHSHRRAFQGDRSRTNELQLLGYKVLRFTWQDLTQRRSQTVGRLRRALQLDRDGSSGPI